MPDTNKQFDEVIAKCRDIFEKKVKDYGTSWRILRITSLTDQLYIKALRIRNLEDLQEQKIEDSIDEEFMGLINYCIIGLVQMKLNGEKELELPLDKATKLYDETIGMVKELMMKKNHDYGEAWRDMRPSSFTDLILTKLLRIKQIEDNQGNTIISEGIDSHYQDIINYSVFALIKMNE